MVDLAIKHLSELNDKFYDIWYDPYYQYYYGQRSRYEISARDLIDRNETFLVHSFVSLDCDGNIIGFISYTLDTTNGLAKNMELVNFGKDSNTVMLFGTDCYKVFKDIFNKFNANTIEYQVYCGNPIEKSYDKICERMGGRVLCIKNKRGILMDGTLIDEKIYQITKEEFLEVVKRRKGED